MKNKLNKLKECFLTFSCGVTLIAMVWGLIMISSVIIDNNPSETNPYLGTIEEVFCQPYPPQQNNDIVPKIENNNNVVLESGNNDIIISGDGVSYCNTTYYISYSINHVLYLSIYNVLYGESCDQNNNEIFSEKCIYPKSRKLWINVDSEDYYIILNIVFIQNSNYVLYTWLGPFLLVTSSLVYIVFIILLIRILCLKSKRVYHYGQLIVNDS